VLEKADARRRARRTALKLVKKIVEWGDLYSRTLAHLRSLGDFSSTCGFIPRKIYLIAFGKGSFSMAKAAEMLRSQGARRIIAVCVHALLVGEALNKLQSAGVERVISANTLPTPSPVDTVDISPLLRYLPNHF